MRSIGTKAQRVKVFSLNNEFKIENYLRRIKIRNRLMLSFLLISLLPVSMIGFLSSMYALNDMENKGRDYSINITGQIVNNIRYFLENYINKFERIALNSTVHEDLSNYDMVDYPKKDEIDNRMWLTVSSIIGFDAGINTVELCTIKGQRFYYSSPISRGNSEQSAFIKAALAGDDIVWKASRKEIMSDSQIYIFLAQKMTQADNSVTGVALMAINKEYIDDICQRNAQKTQSYIVLTDRNGFIISHPDENKIMEYFESDILNRISAIEAKRNLGETVKKYFKIRNKNGAFLVSYDILPENQWRVINVVSYNYLMKSTVNQVRITLGVAFLIILFSIILSFVVTRSIHTPVNNLLLVMREVGQGNLNVKITDDCKSAHDEHSLLAIGFNDMIDRLRKLINDVYKSEFKKKELEFHKKEAELSALQQQINPHFLYNTLECIYWSAQLKDDDEISEMITALGNFFRTNINKGTEYITVRQEIDNIRNYLYLQKARYNQRIHVGWNVREETLELFIIKLILQPIIETVIIYGTEYLEGSADINIKIWRDDYQIVFEIAGRGVEMFQEEANQVESSGNHYKNDNFPKVGVKNLNQRIQLYFGGRYGIEICSSDEEDTIVKMTLPVLEQEPLSRKTVL